ncbi:MAG: CotH kinase family protein [Bacteroidaceae bacterium]|nr:CotH kinase family protein [Bacteroidaceae bacterium]
MKHWKNRMNGMARKALSVLFIGFGSVVCSAQTWIDVTDSYVKNPRFDNNYLGDWEGTSWGAYNQKENAEHYEKTYNTYQRLSGLTPGKYRVSLDAFYRMGSASNDYNLYTGGDYSGSQYAKLYATSSVDEYEVGIAPISSAALQQSLGGGTSTVGGGWWGGGPQYYVPNNMEAAYYWFNAGYYDNVLECEVGDDGELTIGIRKTYTISQDWTCVDNWKLEYWGHLTQATSVTLSASTLDMVLSETASLTATVLPENATYHKVSWSSADKNVATVDDEGNVTAQGVGTTTITALAIDGSGQKATCSVTVTRNDPSSDNIVINEIMPANVDVYLDPSWNYGSWVELYNPTKKGVSLGGLYITNDSLNLKKNRLIDSYGAIPARGFAVLNFDHHEPFKEASYRQINDNLDPEGGVIIISDGENIIAKQTYPQLMGRISYARRFDGRAEWGTTGYPSPGESNEGSSFATEQLPAPVVDQPAQLFTGTLEVQVEIPSGARLRYTTDGSTPTGSSTRSNDGHFTISETTCLRFRLFQTGKLPSPVVTRTYIYDNGNEPFPIISVVTDDAHIFGSDYGLFVQSDKGRPGNGQSGNCTWNMSWDRPVNFEFITTDNECVVSQECDMSACGGWSRAWTPHSFKLKANKQYDLQNSFDYQFFPNKPFLKHKTLQIRNGGNDNGCRIKDGAIQGVVEASGIYVDYQSWQPVHVYFNGSPYAVLNMREPNNKHFAKANYGLDSEELDQFEIGPDSGYVQMAGTDESFLRWYELSQNAADSQVYQEISKLVDIDEYINYMAIEFYIGNWDWPQNNVKGFRSKSDGKFHFVLFDLDGSFSTDTPFNTFFGKQTYGFNTLYGYDYSKGRSIQGTSMTLEIKFVTIFNNMLRNETFKKKFVDAFCLVSGSVFTPELTKTVISERANYLASGGFVSPYSTSNDLINRFANRQNSMINHLQNYFGLNSGNKLTTTLSSNIPEAQLLMNGQEVPTGQFSGSLFSPVTVKAVAPAGYRFAGWVSDVELPSSTFPIFTNVSPWKYYDQGSLDGKNWMAVNYSDDAWSEGTPPIGYDYNNQHPEIETETAGNLPTYYFRKTFDLTSYAVDDEYTLNWIADDGFIVYVNGKEAGRYNMPSGEVTYSKYSSTWAHDNPDRGTMTLDASLFHQGSNLIAVELHNNSGTSTDIYWQASLTAQVYDGSNVDYVSIEPEYTLPTSGTMSLRAVWEQIPAEELLLAGATPVKVNEVSAGNTVYVNEYFKKDDWVELYNTTAEPIDLAGMYLSDDPSEPQKFQIPESDDVNTLIEPDGHFVVWADSRQSVSQLHAPFKLNNAKGESVLITSEDGQWADTLQYVNHGGRRSVGLYPDGSQNVYLMDFPTIGKQNTYTSYAKLIGTKPYNTGRPASSFTLELAEGWNWLSHPLSGSLAVASITENADRFLGQTEQYLYDEKIGWVGSLQQLVPTKGYKVKMLADMDYTYDGPFYDATANPVTLRSGWNWIGYPLLSAQSLSAALSELTSAEGDIIVGQSGFATYENGTWEGSLQTLQPGSAYLYKSSAAKAFRYYDPAMNGNAPAKARFFSQPRSPWTVNMSAYPNVMNIIAKVSADGIETTDYSIGAFTEDGECRGVGKYIGGKLYLTVYGDRLENIFLKAANPETGVISDINEHFFFKADILGRRKAPVQLTLGTATDITSVKRASALAEATYYTLDGRLAARTKSALRTGVYVAKYRLTDGTVLTKKVVVK